MRNSLALGSHTGAEVLDREGDFEHLLVETFAVAIWGGKWTAE